MKDEFDRLLEREWDNEGLKGEVYRLVEEEMARFRPR